MWKNFILLTRSDKIIQHSVFLYLYKWGIKKLNVHNETTKFLWSQLKKKFRIRRIGFKFLNMKSPLHKESFYHYFLFFNLGISQKVFAIFI